MYKNYRIYDDWFLSQGHTVGHAVTGMFGGGSSNEVEPQAQPVQAMPVEQSSQQGACAFEIKQFLQCAQNNDDISLCSGFNEAIRQCKEANRNAFIILKTMLN